MPVACACMVWATALDAEIGVISPAAAERLIRDPDPARRPVVLDTRGGY